MRINKRGFDVVYLHFKNTALQQGRSAFITFLFTMAVSYYGLNFIAWGINGFHIAGTIQEAEIYANH